VDCPPPRAGVLGLKKETPWEWRGANIRSEQRGALRLACTLPGRSYGQGERTWPVKAKRAPTQAPDYPGFGGAITARVRAFPNINLHCHRNGASFRACAQMSWTDDNCWIMFPPCTRRAAPFLCSPHLTIVFSTSVQLQEEPQCPRQAPGHYSSRA
jgi:hypothetical protein